MAPSRAGRGVRGPSAGPHPPLAPKLGRHVRFAAVHLVMVIGLSFVVDKKIVQELHEVIAQHSGAGAEGDAGH